MASGREPGKRAAIAFVSILAWLFLLVAVIATSVAFSISNLNHAGESASTIVQKLSQNPKTLSSIVDELKKNADPQTAVEIEKNRAAIIKAMASLGSSQEFRVSLAKTIDEISQAVLSGASTVRVDFRPIAATISEEINAAAKTTVISKEDLAKIKPQIWNLGKHSADISNVRNRFYWVLIPWLVWLLLVGSLFLLKGYKTIWTAGVQLFSIGAAILIIRFGVPVVANRASSHSDLPMYARDLIPLVFNSLASSIIAIAAVLAAVGFVFMVFGQRIAVASNKKSATTITD